MLAATLLIAAATAVFVLEGREQVVWRGRGDPSEAAVREILALFPYP